MNFNIFLDNLEEEISNEAEELLEAKHTSCLEYDRYWYEFSKEEREEFNKGRDPKKKKIYGIWKYKHRDAAGAKYNDGTVVHHKDRNKHNNRKSNLMKISRSEHCIIDPNALKHKGEKCKVPGCGKPYYAHGFCYNHYLQDYRKKHK